MATVEIDLSEFKAFFQRMEKAAQGDFKRDFETFMEGLGVEFLGLVQDEFISRNKNTGYGQLVSSFTQGGAGNVWRSVDDGLALEIGSSFPYVGYVNDGHRTLDPSKHEGQTRFVPGYWQGNRFIYDPSIRGIDEGVEQITLGWTSRRPYDQPESLQVQSFNLRVHSTYHKEDSSNGESSKSR